MEQASQRQVATGVKMEWEDILACSPLSLPGFFSALVRTTDGSSSPNHPISYFPAFPQKSHAPRVFLPNDPSTTELSLRCPIPRFRTLSVPWGCPIEIGLHSLQTSWCNRAGPRQFERVVYKRWPIPFFCKFHSADPVASLTHFSSSEKLSFCYRLARATWAR
jgi:hypothetical protein